MATKKQADEAKKSMSAKDVMAVMGKLNEEKGKKAIELEVKKAEDFCSTGLLPLDLIMGGGYYGGQVFQFFGPAHSGKSTLGYTSAGWLTGDAGIPTAFFDHEGTTDRAYTVRLGMNYDMVMYFRPATGEWTYEWIDEFCNKLPDKHSGLPQAVMFIDTVRAMKPQKYVDDPDNKQPAIPASMHSKGWDKIQTLITNKHVSVVAANQIRSNVGNPYGSAEKVPGGNAWEFATTNLVRVARGGKNVELPDGRVFQPVKFKTYKNKNFIPMQECEVHLELGVGWDIASEVIEFCKLAGYYLRRKGNQIVKKGGLPSLRGLSKYVDGADGDFKSSSDLEDTIRAQGRQGPIYRACRLALSSGDAIELYRNAKKRVESEDEEIDLLSVKRTKQDALDGATNPYEGDDEDGEDEDDSESISDQDEPEEAAEAATNEDEIPAALGLNRKKKAAAKSGVVRKKKTVAKKKTTKKAASA